MPSHSSYPHTGGQSKNASIEFSSLFTLFPAGWGLYAGRLDLGDSGKRCLVLGIISVCW